MTPGDQKVWTLAKFLCYGGAVLVTVCAVSIGLLKKEPDPLLWDAAIVIVGAGVLLGSYVVLRSMKKKR